MIVARHVPIVHDGQGDVVQLEPAPQQHRAHLLRARCLLATSPRSVQLGKHSGEGVGSGPAHGVVRRWAGSLRRPPCWAKSPGWPRSRGTACRRAQGRRRCVGGDVGRRGAAQSVGDGSHIGAEQHRLPGVRGDQRTRCRHRRRRPSVRRPGCRPRPLTFRTSSTSGEGTRRANPSRAACRGTPPCTASRRTCRPDQRSSRRTCCGPQRCMCPCTRWSPAR